MNFFLLFFSSFPPIIWKTPREVDSCVKCITLWPLLDKYIPHEDMCVHLPFQKTQIFHCPHLFVSESSQNQTFSLNKGAIEALTGCLLHQGGSFHEVGASQHINDTILVHQKRHWLLCYALAGFIRHAWPCPPPYSCVRVPPSSSPATPPLHRLTYSCTVHQSYTSIKDIPIAM